MKFTCSVSTLRTTLAVVVLLLAAGCSSLRTHSDYDPQANFSDFRNFAWAGDQQQVRSKDIGDRFISALNLRRIERAIEDELATKGYRQQDNQDDADFLVSFTVGARDKVDVDYYPVTYRGRWVRHWPYQWESVEVHSYTEGTLAIDIYDRENSRPVWHGVARKRVTGVDVRNSESVINDTVAAILSEFPPP